jgi:hypothetical protein
MSGSGVKEKEINDLYGVDPGSPHLEHVVLPLEWKLVLLTVTLSSVFGWFANE